MALWTPASGTDATAGPRPLADPDGVRAPSPLAADLGLATRGSSLWRDGVRRLRRNRLAMAGGAVIGALSGYVGGRTDLFLTRFIDVMYAFPRLLFVILVMSMLGAGLTNIFIAIGLTGWVGIARQTRAQVLAIKQKEYVEGARALGSRAGRLLFRHVLPNALTPIVVAVTFGIPEAIFTEAALSFIGVGINPPTPSWGQMVGEGQQYIRSYWHLCVFPSIAIAITMLSFTFFGDGVRDALDPKLK